LSLTEILGEIPLKIHL